MINRVLDEYLKPALAHVRRNDDGSFAHDLEEHLRAVAIRSITEAIGWMRVCL